MECEIEWIVGFDFVIRNNGGGEYYDGGKWVPGGDESDVQRRISRR